MAKTDFLRTFVDLLADAVAQRLNSGAKSAPGSKRKRNFTPAGIERIRAAAKKRWARYRKAQGESKSGGANKKRNFSPEGLARIRAAAKKRWERYRKEKRS